MIYFIAVYIIHNIIYYRSKNLSSSYFHYRHLFGFTYKMTDYFLKIKILILSQSEVDVWLLMVWWNTYQNLDFYTCNYLLFLVLLHSNPTRWLSSFWSRILIVMHLCFHGLWIYKTSIVRYVVGKYFMKYYVNNKVTALLQKNFNTLWTDLPCMRWNYVS